MVKDLKVDGRKRIELNDQKGRTISINASKAKEQLAEVKVIKQVLETSFDVEVVFNDEMFEHGNYIKIK